MSRPATIDDFFLISHQRNDLATLRTLVRENDMNRKGLHQPPLDVRSHALKVCNVEETACVIGIAAVHIPVQFRPDLDRLHARLGRDGVIDQLLGVCRRLRFG